ncbi:HAMP domain-containing sensor histidine kinase [Methylotenera sp.]|uniref:sensor histidine kinase n=1 Tax=Methylotenera sp. TaxID=2051956 RepID=UPI00272749D6|nr:HAMP domain-containing sensor histidine kinase [Methylotenera sp.]MDO9206427.1 HAMP domain-containing sensor histidine kinase [Methylotenera sp.]MDO9392706.1 HAMP domain-containing sensor histidine kinase [Methylotenera sp.]MDP1521843.1 HAMP domain-containing sensor histidine kinase [Methylotenera sp.]MDP2070697.1 HAMP domain-containing sensor histidine kinase [Methylotenera sp.]MDP2231441.1 HAMP domain-containing sensor histidine kinase [Methylotenera sp.]
MIKKNRSLKDLLLIHELAFILLIILAAAAGAIGIHLWEKSSQEASRISSLVTEVQQTRGDLYRQMKELFDAYFLDDEGAQAEYDNFTITVEAHFVELKKITVGEAEKAAINDLHENYKKFVIETPALFNQYQSTNSDVLKRALNTDIETGLFKRYEEILARTEELLHQKQIELDSQLIKTKQTSTILLIIPLALAVLLLIFSRVFLKRAIVKPLNDVLKATSEISAGNLTFRAPDEGVAELAAVSNAINNMADRLIISQESLVRTEKQAAQGLLVPMLAHNIRNPLASIRATAQVMDDPGLDLDARESIRGIIDTVDRLERWTGALLAYLLPLKPQPSYTSIKDIIEGALAPLQQKIKEKSIPLTLPKWPENITVFTDQHLLEQVIYNLVLNAVDASTKGSGIEIMLKVKPTTFTLQLLDRGCGMPFTPDPSAMSAPTTKRFGTGLGIPFAFKVCDVLGGELKFVARPGGGTIITILLPKTLNLSVN